MSDKSERAALVGLDWGTSALRVFRFDDRLRLRAERHHPWGIRQLPEGGFETAFAAATEGWVTADTPVLACGMVGSRLGWREAPYLPIPCDLRALGTDFTEIETARGVRIRIVPGLSDLARADVMRGEETEAAGAFAQIGAPDGALTLVMPGTHCKWVQVEDGVIRGFTTCMTGELFAVLSNHSILSASIAHGQAADEAAFDEGVARGARDGIAASLFSTRASVLLGRRPDTDSAAYLSGLLIGDEIARMTGRASSARTLLVGDAGLTARYARAMTLLGAGAPTRIETASASGLALIARAARLLTLSENRREDA